MSSRIAVSVLVFGLCATASRDAAAAEGKGVDEATRIFAENVCAACHGPGGRSTNPVVPSLAAQTRQYLIAKLKVFRDRSGGNTSTHADVLGLSLADDPMAEAFAHYYARQRPPLPVAGDAAAIAAGAALYARSAGTPGQGNCAGCHGENAAGLWIIPRIAGQQAGYVEAQLTRFQEMFKNPSAMHGIVKDMSPGDIKAMAAFVQSK